MSYLGEQKTTKVFLPTNQDYWVVVKVGLKYGELKKFTQYGGTEPYSTIEKFKLSIVEWNLDNESSEVLPIDETSIDLLQEDDVIAIADAATPKQDEKVKKNSPKQ